MHRSARFSRCGTYRYSLSRRWGEPVGPIACFIGLNPSTADAVQDDPTIRRMIGFARAWGMAGMHVVNVFALRSTDRRVLRIHPSPVGRGNDRAIIRYATGAAMVVACWGNDGRLNERGTKVLQLLSERDVNVRCLGTTMGGHPKHPLYVAGATRLVQLRADCVSKQM